MTDNYKPSRMHRMDGWKLSMTDKFQVYKLTLGKNEFTIAPGSIPERCRFPAPNHEVGVNTFRGNSFVTGSFEVTAKGMIPYLRHRGDEIAETRWLVDGGAMIEGMEDHNVFWCINLVNYEDGVFLQKNHPLAPGEEVTFSARELDRYVFVFEGSVTVNGKSTLNAGEDYAHARLGKPQEYTIKNEGDTPAFVLYMYEAYLDEVVRDCDPALPLDKYLHIPILAEDVNTR